MPTEAVWRAILRNDLVYFAVGVLILTIGLLSLISGLLPRRRPRIAIFFGVVGLLYGSRLLFQIGTFPFALGISRHAARETWAVLNYLIPIAGVYVWSYLVSPRSRKILLFAVAAHAVLAAVGITHDLATHRPWQTPFPQINSGLVIGSSLLTACLIVLDIRDRFLPLDAPIRAAGLGFIAFQLGVLYDNLVPLHVVPELWTEPFAFLLFLAGMGYAIQYYIASDRNRLVAMQAELEQARRIQLSILPPGPPSTPHYQVAANYSPMAGVAGDLYDFIPLGEDRIGLFIADVSGHGLPAALVASMLKTALNIHARSATSPAQLLTELNHAFAGQSHGKFVTAAFAVLDAAQHTLTYSAAGHPPLLLWRPTATAVQQLEQNGLPLGILPTAEYSEITIPFAPGDRLAMYTDGIVESENGNAEEFGSDRLSEILQARHGHPGDLLQQAMALIQNWRGHEREQSDDLTLLIAECVTTVSTQRMGTPSVSPRDRMGREDA